MTTSTADAATNSAQNAHPESNVPRSTYIIDTDSGAKHTDQLTGQSKADVASDSSTTNSSFITGYTSASGSNKPTLPAENISSVSFWHSTHALNEQTMDSFQAYAGFFVMK